MQSIVGDFKQILACAFAVIISLTLRPPVRAQSHVRLPASTNDCADLFGSPSFSPGRPIPLSQTPLASTAQIMGRLTAMETALYSTSGFPDRKKLLAAFRRASPTIQEAARILSRENVEVAMAVNSKRRTGIVREGFLNFRESPRGSEAGTERKRELIEGNSIGLTETAYAAMNPKLKSKSAYLKPVRGSGLQAPTSIDMYGGDHFIFRLDDIRDRMTLTAGDSLNRRYVHGGVYGDRENIESWDHIYTPWSQRELLVPALASGLSENRIGVSMHVVLLSPAEAENRPRDAARGLVPLAKIKNQRTPIPMANISLYPYYHNPTLPGFRLDWDFNMDYIEVQIWGALTLDHVSAFEFTEAPPTGRFLKELRQRGIEIRDARVQPPVIWNGEL